MKPRHVTATLCLVLLGGCATPTSVPPIRRGSHVAIMVTASPLDSSGAAVHTSIYTAEMKAGVGAGAGAAAGALYGIACGPLAFICVPGGALIGAGAGALAGAAAGQLDSLPREQATQLRDRLNQLRQSLDPVFELRNNVTERARKHWLLTDDTSGNVVMLEQQILFLTSGPDQTMALAMRVAVSVRPDWWPANAPPRQKTYEYVAPATSLEVWLDERSDVAGTSLRSASQQIAAQIVAELAAN
jgi:hypothetical protein